MDDEDAPAGHLSPKAAAQLVRWLASDPARLFFTDHAIARMAERAIRNRDVLTC